MTLLILSLVSRGSLIFWPPASPFTTSTPTARILLTESVSLHAKLVLSYMRRKATVSVDSYYNNYIISCFLLPVLDLPVDALSDHILRLYVPVMILS